METKKVRAPNGHVWNFVQMGGLVQLQIRSIDDVLNLCELNPKLWVALACPTKGLEFSEETLALLDIDKSGRVRVPEILAAVDYIKKYFKSPEIIMNGGDVLPLDVLSEENFACGYSALDSAKAVLKILGKPDATEISLADLNAGDKLFAPDVINGDGVLPPNAVKNEAAAAVVSDIVNCTGGTADISGAMGITRAQFESFFESLRAMQSWRDSADENADEIFFLKFNTDSAAESYKKVCHKIDDFFLRCSLCAFDSAIAEAITQKEDSAVTEVFSSIEHLEDHLEQFIDLPIASCEAGKSLPLSGSVNPAWQSAIDDFAKNVVRPILGDGKTCVTEAEWKKIKDMFTAYMAWHSARPENAVDSMGFERIHEILSSDSESIIASYLDEEEKHPPVALAALDLRKMILYCRDFVELLRNFVSFEKFYDVDGIAIFQCGILYIDGRSCSLCFRVTDMAKHANMAPLSQCYLLYCDCTQPSTGEKMQIAALVSAGHDTNLMVGRNGLFYDRSGRDWDATITKIVENPISIREAFWSPYRKLARMVQERISKMASAADEKVDSKLASSVDNPNAAAANASADAKSKKFDVGTIAAISVAFTGIATVVGGLLAAFLGLGYWIPLGIAGIILAISLPSMLLAWLKLRQRNIAPILDACGWAVNGNVKINIPLGSTLTHLPVRPKGSHFSPYDPYTQKQFPIKRLIFFIIIIALAVWFIVSVAKNPNGVSGVIESIKMFFGKFLPKK